MDIVIASNNQHKIEEYKEILRDFDVNIYSLKDKNIISDPEENGETFEENSLIKGLNAAKYTPLVVISDDSGLIVDELKDILGVKTSRFMGENTPYEIKRQEVINRLEGKDRTARFVCCITLLNFKDFKPITFKGECVGSIAFESKGTAGFGYDPIFIPKGYTNTFSELGEDIKNSMSHRGNAAKKLVEFLKENM